MTDKLKEQVEERLKQITFPGIDRDIVSLGFIEKIQVEGTEVTVDFSPTTDDREKINKMEAEIEEALQQLEGVSAQNINTSLSGESSQKEGKKAIDRRPIEGAENVIAVASGKGGVGKSTVAVNLACALKEEGFSVGVEDLDIYGPSMPTMFGLNDRPELKDQETMVPLTHAGIKVMSLGFVIEPTEPVIWRGPMANQAVQQLIRQVDWGGIDYLVIDLPPGTGDIQLTLMQKVPLTGAIIVTTPQEVALPDVRKSVRMFQKLDIPVLGVVENMDQFICPDCGHQSHIFGQGGARQVCEELDVDLLGGVPLSPQLRESSDSGSPLVLEDPEHPASRAFMDIAEKISS